MWGTHVDTTQKTQLTVTFSQPLPLRPQAIQSSWLMVGIVWWPQIHGYPKTSVWGLMCFLFSDPFISFKWMVRGCHLETPRFNGLNTNSWLFRGCWYENIYNMFETCDICACTLCWMNIGVKVVNHHRPLMMPVELCVMELSIGDVGRRLSSFTPIFVWDIPMHIYNIHTWYVAIYVICI